MRNEFVIAPSLRAAANEPCFTFLAAEMLIP